MGVQTFELGNKAIAKLLLLHLDSDSCNIWDVVLIRPLSEHEFLFCR